MDKESITFGDNEIQKSKFPCYEYNFFKKIKILIAY